MIILQEVFFVTSAPDDIQMVLGAFFVIATLVLISLSVEVGIYPSVRDWVGTFLTADYWIRRQKRRAFARTFGVTGSAYIANPAASSALCSKPRAPIQVV